MIKLIYGIKVPYVIFKTSEFSNKFEETMQKIYKEQSIMFNVWSNKSQIDGIVGISVRSTTDSFIQLSSEEMNNFSGDEKLTELFGIAMKDVIQEWFNYFTQTTEKLKNEGVSFEDSRKGLEAIALPEQLETKWFVLETT
jgi:hypothetical protein